MKLPTKSLVALLFTPALAFAQAHVFDPGSATPKGNINFSSNPWQGGAALPANTDNLTIVNLGGIPYYKLFNDLNTLNLRAWSMGADVAGDVVSRGNIYSWVGGTPGFNEIKNSSESHSLTFYNTMDLYAETRVTGAGVVNLLGAVRGDQGATDLVVRSGYVMLGSNQNSGFNLKMTGGTVAVESTGGLPLEGSATLDGTTNAVVLYIMRSQNIGNGELNLSRNANINFISQETAITLAAVNYTGGTGSTARIYGTITSTNPTLLLNGNGGSGAGADVTINCISGTAMNVEKNGNSTFSVTSLGSYTGTTTINEGRLNIEGTLSSGGGSVSIAPGAVLGGSGEIQRDVFNQGTIAPRTYGPAALTIEGLTTFAANSTLKVSVFGTSPANFTSLNATAVSIDPTAGILLDLLGVPESALAAEVGPGNSRTYTVINGSAGSVDNFATTNLTLINGVGYSSDQWQINPNPASGKVELVFTTTPVPEPTSVLAIATAALLGLAARRVRHRRCQA